MVSGTNADEVQTAPCARIPMPITAIGHVFGFASPLALIGISTEFWFAGMVVTVCELIPGGLYSSETLIGPVNPGLRSRNSAARLPILQERHRWRHEIEPERRLRRPPKPQAG